MEVLIIYCHPSQKSYTYQVLNQLKETLKKEKINFQVSDLYKIDFQSDMTEQEYMREGLLDFNKSISIDVLKEQEKIEKADCIIFLYPVWWSDCPSKLKGWFDRVYSVGYAYGHKHKENTIKKMKPIPYGIALCTAGHPNEFLEKIGIAKSMETVMIDDRLGQRFIKKEMIILGGTLELDKVVHKHSEIVKNISSKIKEHCI